MASSTQPVTTGGAAGVAGALASLTATMEERRTVDETSAAEEWG
jgi:hypothetical protein